MTTKRVLLAAALLTLAPVVSRAETRVGATLMPPVTPACISSAFGPRVLPEHPQAGTYHYGVDLPAAVGAGVYAAAPGTVMRIQRKGPGGLEMLVQHDGFVGVYSHFGMVTPAFAEGKRTVAAGEKLGVVGRTGISTGGHLYFGILLAGKPVDPAPYLRVPACNGELPRVTPPLETVQAGKPSDGGVLIGARKYYQVFLPSQPTAQLQSSR